MSKAKAGAFLKTFKPYRGKFTIQTAARDLFGDNQWYTVQQYLGLSLIEAAILADKVVGWFLNTVPHVVGVDIDDHQGLGEGYLMNVYDQTVQRMRCRPSVMFRSPHGLHAYWILTERMPAEVLVDLSKQRLKGLPVEVKPTVDTALRIPAENHILDTVQLQAINIPFEVLVEEVVRYHPAVLFDEQYMPDQIRLSLQERRSRHRALKAYPKVEKLERELLPFTTGDTNEKFVQLAIAYRNAGLDQEQAFYRFTMCLAQSLGYYGDLANPQRLEKRIRSIYEKNRVEFVPKTTRQLDLFGRIVADEIAQRSPFAKQRRKPIERFVSELLSWKEWHDEIWKSPRRVATFDALYPYYRKNRREGFYPLPRGVMEKWNDRYNELLPWLQEVGLITPAPYPYVPNAGVSRYYRIDPDQFVVEDPTTTQGTVLPPRPPKEEAACS